MDNCTDELQLKPGTMLRDPIFVPVTTSAGSEVERDRQMRSQIGGFRKRLQEYQEIAPGYILRQC